MTREEALRRLAELDEPADPEANHVEADRILCALLASLGYDDVVAAFDRIFKWYA